MKSSIYKIKLSCKTENSKTYWVWVWPPRSVKAFFTEFSQQWGLMKLLYLNAPTVVTWEAQAKALMEINKELVQQLEAYKKLIGE